MNPFRSRVTQDRSRPATRWSVSLCFLTSCPAPGPSVPPEDVNLLWFHVSLSCSLQRKTCTQRYNQVNLAAAGSGCSGRESAQKRPHSLISVEASASYELTVSHRPDLYLVCVTELNKLVFVSLESEASGAPAHRDCAQWDLLAV